MWSWQCSEVCGTLLAPTLAMPQRNTLAGVCRLRRISVDPTIGTRQAISCMERLLHHHLALSTASDGLSLRISHENRMTADSATADIAWNFEL